MLTAAPQKVLQLMALLTAVAVAQPQISVTRSAQTVGRYDIIEFTVECPSASYSNVWEDVTVVCALTSPSAEAITIGGFYYEGTTWKARFAPWETGTYDFDIAFTDQGGTASASGSFACEQSGNAGFVRRHATNPYRLVTESDGRLFPALGWGTCVTFSPNEDNWNLDGGFRDLGDPWVGHSLEEYLTALAGEAGMNTFRFSVNNCAYNMWAAIAPTGNQYLVTESQWTDTLCLRFREKGVRIYLDIFGWQPVYRDEWQDAAKMDAVKRYVKYMVDRYGAWVDIWEIANESTVPPEWASIVSQYLKSVAPYGHDVSISWEQPGNDDIDIVSPHWYEKEHELASDTRTREEISRYRWAG